MQKAIVILIFCLFSQTLFAGTSGKTLYKCQFLMKNQATITAWFEVGGYEEFCYIANNETYLNDAGMEKVIAHLKRNSTKLQGYKRVFIPKYAKPNMICALQKEDISIDLENVKSVHYVATLREFDASWDQVALVNQEMLDLLNNKKPINTSSVGETLQSYIFINYNPEINETDLQGLANEYMKILVIIYKESQNDEALIEINIKKLNAALLQRKIAIFDKRSAS